MHGYWPFLALFMLVWPRVVFAQEATVVESRPVPVAAAPQRLEPQGPDERWYGGQTLAADGISLAVLMLGALEEPFAYVGVGGLLVAAPIVHFGHGNVGRGFLSLGMRTGLPFGTAAVGYGLTTGACPSDDDADYCGGIGAVVGLFVGSVAAVVLDSAVLAWEPAPEPPPGVSWSPSLAATPNSAQLLVSGNF